MEWPRAAAWRPAGAPGRARRGTTPPCRGLAGIDCLVGSFWTKMGGATIQKWDAIGVDPQPYQRALVMVLDRKPWNSPVQIGCETAYTGSVDLLRLSF